MGDAGGGVGLETGAGLGGLAVEGGDGDVGGVAPEGGESGREIAGRAGADGGGHGADEFLRQAPAVGMGEGAVRDDAHADVDAVDPVVLVPGVVHGEHLLDGAVVGLPEGLAAVVEEEEAAGG